MRHVPSLDPDDRFYETASPGPTKVCTDFMDATIAACKARSKFLCSIGATPNQWIALGDSLHAVLFEKGRPVGWKQDNENPDYSVPDRKTKEGKAAAKAMQSAALVVPCARKMSHDLGLETFITGDGGMFMVHCGLRQIGKRFLIKAHRGMGAPAGCKPLKASQYYAKIEKADKKAIP